MWVPCWAVMCSGYVVERIEPAEQTNMTFSTWHYRQTHTQTASCWLLKPICFSVKQQERETVAGLVVRNCGSLTLKYLEVTICTARVTFNNSTFCPHSVFMCFVWIWEQTAFISLYYIKWLVFITETERVYCAVRTGSLYIILRSAHTVYLCVLCRSQNKLRLFPYTALTDWFL